jgi:hypothetical protein
MLAGLHPYALLQAAGAGSRTGSPIVMLVTLAIIFFMIASMWKVFEKAGEPGWACLIPIYNTVVLLKIAGKPFWWLILMLFPIVNLIVFIVVAIAIAERFGKGVGFGLGLAILGFIFFPVLAFGEARYSRA